MNATSPSAAGAPHGRAPKKAALAKVDATGKKLVPIIDCREGVWGIKPRNREQHFALDALLGRLIGEPPAAGSGMPIKA